MECKADHSSKKKRIESAIHDQILNYDLRHDGKKRNQMLHLGYNCMVLVHLLVD